MFEQEFETKEEAGNAMHVKLTKLVAHMVEIVIAWHRLMHNDPDWHYRDTKEEALILSCVATMHDLIAYFRVHQFLYLMDEAEQEETRRVVSGIFGAQTKMGTLEERQEELVGEMMKKILNRDMGDIGMDWDAVFGGEGSDA